MEFKDVLRERLEIEYTKRLFAMIPSIISSSQLIIYFRGINLNFEKCTYTKI